MNTTQDQDYETIDLLELLYMLQRRWLLLVLSTVVAAGIGFGVSRFWMTPMYQASALMIVNTRQDTTANVTSDQINSAKNLVSTYSIIVKSNDIMQNVVTTLGLNCTAGELAKRISVNAVDSTQVMQVSITSDDPEWARRVIEQVTLIAPDVIVDKVEAGSVKVISPANVGSSPISPNVGRNTAIAGMLGLVLCAGIIILAGMLDNKVRSEEDVRKYLDITVLGVIPTYTEGEKDKGGKKDGKAN